MENFFEESPKKNLKIKDEPTSPDGRTNITPIKMKNFQSERPKVSNPQRDPRSRQICKVASKDSIRIYYQNVRSIHSEYKQKKFRSDLACDFDVIVFTETWLMEDKSRLQIFDDGFDIYRCDRSRSYKDGCGGGVLVAVSSKLYSDPVVVEEFDFLEFVSLKIFHKDHYLYLYCFYMPGEIKHHMSGQHIRAIEAMEYSKNDTLMVIGDFNMPNIKWVMNEAGGFRPSDATKMTRSVTTMLGGSLKDMCQLNDIKNDSGNVLDLAFVNKPDGVSLLPVRGKDALMDSIDKSHPPFEIIVNATEGIHLDNMENMRKSDMKADDSPFGLRYLLRVFKKGTLW